ncbi:MAG: type II toxin-antitoxin system RelE/ParE family toxin [Alphaproteobacteria bacterium]|jgi:addiction module RelE/StbE family toxin|nr:type II toxin-antitoxin system RelE/ParE family toxin [Alphaproteobacteria bacterium]
MEIIYTTRFSNHFSSIKNYLSENHNHLLEQTISVIDERINTIKHNPYMGRIGVRPNTRELVFRKLPYILVYRVAELEQKIFLVAIFHTSQNRNSLL